jgi:hypothetical protein
VRLHYSDASDVTKAKLLANTGNAHFGAPPSVVKPASSNGGSIPPTEKVHPPVKTVDLLGLDQPPSVAQEEEEDEDEILRKLQKRLSSKKLTMQDLEPDSPKEALSGLMPPRPAPFKEQLSDLMPPRPSPPPHVLKAMKKKAEEAEAKAKAAAASVAADDSSDHDETEGDVDTSEEMPSPALAASGNGGGGATKSSKKKKGKKVRLDAAAGILIEKRIDLENVVALQKGKK